MMMMMLLRRRTLPKSCSSFLNRRHVSSCMSASQYEQEKHLYTTVKSLLGNSELDKALEYARSPVVERSGKATRSAIFELLIPELFHAQRYKDVASLDPHYHGFRCYHSLVCPSLIKRSLDLWRAQRMGKKAEAEAKRWEVNTCLVSNPPPYPIIIQGEEDHVMIISSPPKNQYFDESHLYSTVKFLIHNLSDLDTAVEYARFTAFSTSRTETTTATCDLIIAALCEAKRYTDAYHLFHYFFNQSNISLSFDCCNHIVKALCDDGHAHVALQLHHHIHHSHDDHHLDYQTYRILTKALYLSGYLDEALDLLKDIFSLDNPYKYDSILLDQRDFDKAWALCCEELLITSSTSSKEDGDNNNNNNNASYPTVTKTAVRVSLIEYHFSKGEDEKAMEIYTCLVAETSGGGKIEDASKRPVLDVLFKYGKETEAWALVKNHRERASNLFYCKPTSCDPNGHDMAHEAIDRFQGVRQMQDFVMCKFNHAPYTNVITKCCEDENTLPHAKFILDGLLNKHDPSAYKISTFQQLINSYLKAGRLDDALETANLMLDANLRLVSNLLKG